MGQDQMNDGYDDLFAWLKAEQDAVGKGEHDFTCPLCGSPARWERSEYNWHLHSWCTGCKMRVME